MTDGWNLTETRKNGIFLRLSDWEAAHVDLFAAQCHMKRSEWLRMIIRREIDSMLNMDKGDSQ